MTEDASQTPSPSPSPASPSNHPAKNPGKLDLICAQQFEPYENLYKIVDFLNRNLRKYNLMFGLSKDHKSMTINIYEVD